MRQSRYEYMERRDEPTRRQGRFAAKQRGGHGNPHPYGSRKYWLWQDAYDAERKAQQEARRAAQRPRPAAVSRRPAGAPVQSLAQLAGALCNNTAFLAWGGFADSDEAAAWVRRVCGVKSRRELDTDPAAAKLFHDRVRRPFAASRDQ
ncbi:hypothetical protein H0A73_17335 [Alcaligenaceae bacterium]|nr:hypothetical protein [Alcaligenaceae bacterium]